MKTKARPKRSLLLILAGVVFAVVIVVACVLNYVAGAENKRKAALANAECSAVMTENEEMESFLSEEDHDAYYEQIAREKYGYAKPGERVFYYDSSDN